MFLALFFVLHISKYSTYINITIMKIKLFITCRATILIIMSILQIRRASHGEEKKLGQDA